MAEAEPSRGCKSLDVEVVGEAVDLLRSEGFAVDAIGEIERDPNCHGVRFDLAVSKDNRTKSMATLEDAAEGSDDDDAPEEAETDSADEVGDGEANPYEPDDLGTFEVEVRQSAGEGVYLSSAVSRHFDDADRVHVREADDRFELAPGTSDDWPDYAVNERTVWLGTPAAEVLDVVEGDEVVARADGDVVVLEPNRIADRSFEQHSLGVHEVKDYSHATILYLTAKVAGFFDTETVSVREVGGEVQLVGGDLEDCPNYSVGASAIQVGKPGVELLGAAPGDEVRATAIDEGTVHLELEGDGDGDDAAIATKTFDEQAGGASRTCQNCGSQVTADYARVFAPEADEAEGPRVCPNCEDKIRDGGDVRESRSTRGNKGGSA